MQTISGRGRAVGQGEVGRRRGGVVQRLGLGFRVDLVRVFPGGNQVVDQADQQHAAEERRRIDPMAPVVAVLRRECLDAFEEDLDKGDIEHHPRRESRGHRQKAIVGPAGREGNDAADRRGHAGKHGQTKRHPDIAHNQSTVGKPSRARKGVGRSGNRPITGVSHIRWASYRRARNGFLDVRGGCGVRRGCSGQLFVTLVRSNCWTFFRYSASAARSNCSA